MGMVTDYLATVDAARRPALERVVARAHDLVPGLVEGTAYGMPVLLHRGKPLLSAVEAKAHLALYPHSGVTVDLVAADLDGFILGQAPRLAAAKTGDPAFGLLHFANSGEVTWKGFAEAIFAEALGDKAPVVGGQKTADYVTPARRPLRATMDLGRLQAVFGVTPRPWQAALSEILAELKAG